MKVYLLRWKACTGALSLSPSLLCFLWSSSPSAMDTRQTLLTFNLPLSLLSTFSIMSTIRTPYKLKWICRFVVFLVRTINFSKSLRHSDYIQRTFWRTAGQFVCFKMVLIYFLSIVCKVILGTGKLHFPLLILFLTIWQIMVLIVLNRSEMIVVFTVVVIH